mgnify:FL=1
MPEITGTNGMGTNRWSRMLYSQGSAMRISRLTAILLGILIGWLLSPVVHAVGDGLTRHDINEIIYLLRTIAKNTGGI